MIYLKVQAPYYTPYEGVTNAVPVEVDGETLAPGLAQLVVTGAWITDYRNPSRREVWRPRGERR